MLALIQLEKDLANVALPVTFNEPLTLLQRAAEEIEYHELLTQAAEATDPVERLCYVAAFAVSSYAHTRFRSGRKGLWVHSNQLFIPLLTFSLAVIQCLRKLSRNPG